MSLTYHLSKSVRRSVSLNICSAVLAKYYNNSKQIIKNTVLKYFIVFLIYYSLNIASVKYLPQSLLQKEVCRI